MSANMNLDRAWSRYENGATGGDHGISKYGIIQMLLAHEEADRSAQPADWFRGFSDALEVLHPAEHAFLHQLCNDYTNAEVENVEWPERPEYQLPRLFRGQLTSEKQ